MENFIKSLTEHGISLNDWAKTHDGIPGISVRQHMRTVASVADVLLRHFPFLCRQCSITPQTVLFLAAAHDVGKLSVDFLQQSAVWLEAQGLKQRAVQESWKTLYTRKHALISRDSFQKFCLDNKLVSRKSAACWAAVIGAHHGRIVKQFTSAPLVLRVQECVLEEERQSCLQEMWERYAQPALPEVEGKNDSSLWCIAGLITLADWIGSDEQFFPADQALPEPVIEQRAKEAVQSIGLGLPAVVEGLDFSEIFAGKVPYPLQKTILNTINTAGIHIIEAPMGMGKTEAALWAAYNLLQQGKANGIFFALPTQTTSNRMFLRFADFVHHICPDAAPAQLIHGNSWLQEELKALVRPLSEDVSADPCWFNTSRRALFAPFGVGTVDQALLAVLAVKHFPLRRFALAGKVIVIDEVHTYDMYTGTLIQHLCHELEALGCTIIILSATLTETARCTLLGQSSEGERADAPYPRVSARAAGKYLPEQCPPAFPDKTVYIEHPDRETALTTAMEVAQKGAQVLWICNTVAHAQEDFSLLRERAAKLAMPPDMGLLHSRFPFYRRKALEQEWMERLGVQGNRQRGSILVATQIVEQSVDLDADVLFSELAPTDMLLQRLGRLWRHARVQRPVPQPLFYLLRESATCEEFFEMDAQHIEKCLGDKAYVYSPYVLMRTLMLWEQLSILPLPSHIRGLIAATYEEKALPSSWEMLYDKTYGKDIANKMLANMGTDIWQVALDDEVCLQTRLGADDACFVLCRAAEGRHMVLLEGDEVTLPENDKRSLAAARKLHRNVLRFPTSYLAKKAQDARLAPYQIHGYLRVEKGKIIQPELKAGWNFYWDDELGLVIRKEE